VTRGAIARGVVNLLSLAALAACGGGTASIGPAVVDVPLPSGHEATARRDEAATETPPPPLASRESPFPKVARTKLPSGLDVAVAEAHALPLVQVRVLVRAGGGYGGVAGAAEMTAELMKDGGTRAMSSAQVLERIESLGATLSVDVDMDSSRLGLAVPKNELDAALSILAEVVTHPAFDEGELGKLKGRKRDEARDNARSNGTWMATRALFHELYAQENPYSTYDLVPSEIGKISGLTVREFHARYWVPKNASVILVGDVDGGAATKAVEKAFGAWRGGDPPRQAFPPAIALARRRVILVSRAKSAQSDVLVTSLVPPRATPDWPALRVANQVLGGGVSGRLFQDVREQRSLAYSAQSRIMELSHGEQPLVVYVGTQTPKTGAAVQGALENLERMLSAPPTDAETESARRYLSDVFAIRMETIGSIADLLAQQSSMGLPDGYWDGYRAAVRATDAAQAGAAAAKIVKPSQCLIVVAGDADVIAPVLVHFGEVTILDPTEEFRAVKTLPMNLEAPLEVGK
jgi:predicted Zn-dependent peptidase